MLITPAIVQLNYCVFIIEKTETVSCLVCEYAYQAELHAETIK